MRVNKGMLSVIAVTTVASLGGLTTTATAATKKVTTTYSSQSHTLIIRGQTSRHAKLVLNYQGKRSQLRPLKPVNSRLLSRFKVTEPLSSSTAHKY